MFDVSETFVTTARLTTRVLCAGPDTGEPLVLVHGNLSNASWWRDLMVRLPEGYRIIAPDLRGYGGAELSAKIDATRGLRDFSDDLAALLDVLTIEAAHFVGHSLGGGVLWRMLADHPDKVKSLALVCPSSPHGYGGCKKNGGPCFPDGAGSGAGAVNPQFATLLAAGTRSNDSDSHPLSVLNKFVWNPPFVPAEIERLLDGALSQHCGEQDYPGDARASGYWPMIAPGRFGPVNALSPVYQTDALGFTDKTHAPILWVRGADDQIVADGSLFDLGTLGKMGLMPGWPGEALFPPQPMVQQTENALKIFEEKGGRVTRAVFEACGHSPHIEKPDAFDAAFRCFLTSV